jgi:heterodisulfide reductase subunit C
MKTERNNEINLDPNFKYEVAAQPGGEHILRCFACGTCTASCPVQELEEQYSPRRFIRMIQLGMRKEVLESDFIWQCAGCQTCYEHCPQDVRFSEISHAIKKLALKEAEQGKFKIAGTKSRFDQIFVENILTHGRLYEMGLMIRLFTYNPDIKEILGYVPTGLKMVQTGKLKFLPPNIKNRAQARKLFTSVFKEETDVELDMLPSKIRNVNDVKTVVQFLAKEGNYVIQNLLPANTENINEVYKLYRRELYQFANYLFQSMEGATPTEESD